MSTHTHLYSQWADTTTHQYTHIHDSHPHAHPSYTLLATQPTRGPRESRPRASSHMHAICNMSQNMHAWEQLTHTYICSPRYPQTLGLTSWADWCIYSYASTGLKAASRQPSSITPLMTMDHGDDRATGKSSHLAHMCCCSHTDTGKHTFTQSFPTCWPPSFAPAACVLTPFGKTLLGENSVPPGHL